MRSFALPALSQVLPRCFPPCFAVSRPGPTLLTPARKRTGGSCGPSTKMVVHVPRYVGRSIVPGDGNPPRFCLQGRSLACANPQSILPSACSRLLSRCNPYSFRPPLLCSSCTDDPICARGNLAVVSLHRQPWHEEQTSKGAREASPQHTDLAKKEVWLYEQMHQANTR